MICKTDRRKRERERGSKAVIRALVVLACDCYFLLFSSPWWVSPWRPVGCTVHSAHTHTQRERAGHELCISLDLIVNETEKMPFRQFSRSVGRLNNNNSSSLDLCCVSVYHCTCIGVGCLFLRFSFKHVQSALAKQQPIFFFWNFVFNFSFFLPFENTSIITYWITREGQRDFEVVIRFLNSFRRRTRLFRVRFSTEQLGDPPPTSRRPLKEQSWGDNTVLLRRGATRLQRLQ